MTLGFPIKMLLEGELKPWGYHHLTETVCDWKLKPQTYLSDRDT